jgi:uncharacterized protein YbjT (DUF2867 family)
MRNHERFIDAAVSAGVAQVIYTSFLGAAPQATFTLARDHYATERLLEGSGLATTIVRDSLYADFFPSMVEDDKLSGPADDGRVAPVARADVADAIAGILCDPESHRGRRYDLTGPAALSMAEIADRLSAHLGRAIRYVPQTLDEAYGSRASSGVPRWQLDAWVSTYTAIAAGELASVSQDVSALTRRAPRSFEEVLAGMGTRSWSALSRDAWLRCGAW